MKQVNKSDTAQQSKRRFKLTEPISSNYIKNILPYQLVIESLALQNQQIYELQKKYIEMSQQISKIKPPAPEDEQLLATRQKQQILQRRLFMEEALIQQQPYYKAMYEKKRNQRQQEINLLKTDIELKVGGKINIFMNLDDEGLFWHLMEENKGNEQIINNIKYWKDAYRSKKNQA